jgi:hypothetical protein
MARKSSLARARFAFRGNRRAASKLLYYWHASALAVCDDFPIQPTHGQQVQYPPRFSLIMPEDQPSSVYRVQLSSLHRGYALWNPNPMKEIYDRISIGDVGYVNNKGIFHRMFNVTLEWDNSLNSKLGQPDPYERLDCGPFVNTSEMHFDKGDYYTPNVSSERNIDNPVSQK